MGKGGWLRIITYLTGLGALFAMLWFAGPLLQVGDFRPFENPGVRGITMGLGAITLVGALIYDIRSRWTSAAELAKGLAGVDGGRPGEPAKIQDDSETLQQRMNDALATLKKSSAAKGNYLYDLPWYVIIGPPGSGKTTALINSGLKFPLARGGVAPAAIAGVGGTRYCDWWFTEEAVLIDTAGRYTTQDSDEQSDKSSWLSFLSLLKKNRAKQPINGVFVCISIEDVLKLPADEVRAHADAIRARLIELHKELKVDFPVYAMFTKADLISGFMEFFSHRNEIDRRVVWGATFQTNDKTVNMVTSIPDEFDLLVERLNQELVDRIQDEPTPTARVQLFGFPSQLAALKEPVFNFLNQIFEPTRYHQNATLRGFYFTSGTQHGTPIDQLIGALERSFGAQDVGGSQYSGLGKSYFLTDLLEKVVFKEAGWVSTNLKAVRRAFILKAAGYSLLVAFCAGIAGAWWISYRNNTDLIGQSYGAVSQFKTALGNKGLRDETTVTDADFIRVLEPLHYLRNMPAGYGVRGADAPVTATFGLSQRPRLNSAAESAYDAGLQRLFRPRLMFRLEEALRAGLSNPGALTEPLKVYLMVAGKEPPDRKLVLEWWRQEWAERFPGAGNAAGRQALTQHLERLLEIDPPEGVSAVDIHEALVQEVQSAIGRLSVADRAFDLLRSGARVESARDWTVRRKGGQDVALVFEGANGIDLDSIRVPFFFTYAGFHEAFLGRLDAVAEKVREERKVLGDVAAQQALVAQYEQLPKTLLDRYTREFVAAWTIELRKLRARLLTADRPRYVGLQAAAAQTSPFVSLIESIKEETSLTRERPAAPAGQAPATPKPAPAKLLLPGGEAPGAQVEAAFRPFHLLVEGDRGRRQVDELTKFLGDIHQALAMLNDPVRAPQGRVQFQESLRSLQATSTRFPQPFQLLIQNVAASFDNDATSTIVARIQQAVTEQLTGTCQQAIAGVYPFVRTSQRDINVQEFQRIFGPNGLLERFFVTTLAQYANTSGASWSWVQASPVGRQLPAAMIQSFQRADEIKRAFFPAGAPGFSFAVKNLSVGESVELARLEINSQQLTTEKPKPPTPPAPSLFGGTPTPPPPPPPPGPAPVVMFQWPGPVGLGGATLTLGPDIPGRTSTLQRPGPWGLFRLLDGSSVSQSGQALIVRMSVGGREAQYQVNPSTVPNPFTLAALRNFSCPVAR